MKNIDALIVKDLLITLCVLFAIGASVAFLRQENNVVGISEIPLVPPLSVSPVSSTPPAPTFSTTPLPVSSITPILVYHSIGPQPTLPESKMQAHYRITPEMFERQMQYLQDHNYKPITFSALTDYLSKGIPIPENAIVLTFDDGWKNQYTYAVPILEKHGFTATFFIMTKVIGGGYMTWDEIKDVHTRGFEIASHTETHAKLTEIDDEKLFKEIEGSKRTLEEKLGTVITTLAYPYYQQDERIREMVKNAGYVGARAGWGDFVNDTARVYRLKSQEVVNNPNPFSEKPIVE